MYAKSFFFILACNAPLLAWKDETRIKISDLTNQIHNRFYVIKRLEKLMHAFYNLHDAHKLKLPTQLISFLKTTEEFDHPLIKKCVKELIQTKTLQPIFNCWQKIITYKQVDDFSLSIEFSQLIYDLLAHLINHAKLPDTKAFQALLTREIELPLPGTHQVSFRFYVLKRLTKSYELIKNETQISLHALPDIQFSHPYVAQCYEKMRTTRSLNPLQNLYAQVHLYRFINDSVFMHDFLQLLFVTHVLLFTDATSQTHIHSFTHTASLSVIELLDAIDIELGKYDHTKQIHIMLEENFDFSPNRFSHYVYRRFYFIQRLERIMNLFKEANRHYNPAILFDFNSSVYFKHARIRESIRSMENEQNLKPLFSVWEEFITYKSIEDQLFVEEFTKEIFVISRNMLTCSGLCPDGYRPASTSNTHELLDIIDFYADELISQTSDQQLSYLNSNTPIRMPDLEPEVHIDDVVLRFYHIHRLGVIFWLLNEIQKKGIPVNINYRATQRGVLIDEMYQFRHEFIISTIRIMEQTQSIEPLMGLLQGVQRYKFIDDPQFAREYLTLTLITLHHLQLHHTPKLNRSDPDPLDILDDLPLEKILDALDMISEELPIILEKYELNAEIEWNEWFKKYWWAPAIIAGTLFIKLCLIFHESKLPKPPKPKINNTGNSIKPPPIIKPIR